jgi:N6-L-threonylcarbamoyladenine synthase
LHNKFESYITPKRIELVHHSMRILSIETSCDETAISIIEATGEFPTASYRVLGNALFSQVDIHREYGGVFPAVAKREHAKTLVPMLERALSESSLLEMHNAALSPEVRDALATILHREPGLSDALLSFLEQHRVPAIDLIAVTSGPGLEPALWVGINFAKALSYIWDIPLVPTNHMEGHVLSSIFTETGLPPISFPALALLISGGHTELVLMRDWSMYEKIGETRDDAVGEAFDKTARMLGLPYPGGPEISAQAQIARAENLPRFVALPRPMIDTDNYDFSFSGLKTAVRYAIEGKAITDHDKASIAREFEDAATEVLLAKTRRAVDAYSIRTIIVGGGVSANQHIRTTFTECFKNEYPDCTVYFPPRHLSTDNSVMIALAGHARVKDAKRHTEQAAIQADGNLSLA